MDTALMSTADAARSGAYTNKDLPMTTVARRTPVLRHGWLARLVGAASLPGGIPPGRSRPEPPTEGS